MTLACFFCSIKKHGLIDPFKHTTNDLVKLQIIEGGITYGRGNYSVKRVNISQSYVGNVELRLARIKNERFLVKNLENWEGIYEDFFTKKGAYP
jgi:hypothetical protein